MKIRVIYGLNNETGARKYYINMSKYNPETNTTERISEDKYEEIFETELRGCVARFQYQP
jgi:hypothetical protein